MCDEIHSILKVGNINSRQYDYRAVNGDYTLLNDDVFDFACISKKDVNTYLKGQKGYGWHISDLKIYDKPKELIEFKKINRDCWYADLGLAKRDCPECKNKNCFVQRPPQSWCYVERLVGEE